MKYDCIIIGAGVTGTSIAYELSKYKLNILLLEAKNDIAMATTKANSGIVHAGYDPIPGTKMARLNVQGSQIMEKLAKELNIHYKQVGSLVIGKTLENHKLIDELYERGVKNGVKDLRILNKEEVHKIEPCLNDDIDYALYAPTAAVIAPWEIALALCTNAVINGTTLVRNALVTNIEKSDCYVVETTNGTYEADYVFNAAGLYADKVYELLTKEEVSDSFKITPVKGEYYLLDKGQGKLANTVIFQTPNELGKGVLVSPTVHGNLIVGPDANSNNLGKDDVSTTSDALAYVRNASSLTTTKVNFRDNIRNFSGERATIKGREDFLIEESCVYDGFFNFGGIKSPGISCNVAFGLEAVAMLEAKGVKLSRKEDIKVQPLPKYFKDMTPEEINEKIKENPLYGRIICRCETVSEGEIVDALHSVVPATTIDGVKRRCNAGMGRCQGGFCGPKVLEIIKRELNMKAKDILQDGNGSNIVLEYTKGANENE